MKKIFGSLIISVFALSANATLLTSNTLITPTTIDFSDQANQTNVIGPVQIGNLVGEDVTVESSSLGNGLYFNFNGWGLAGNGTWGSPKTYVSLNGSNDIITFAFNDGPVSGVGGFMNYAPINSDLFITALDSGMNILESYNVTNLADIVTPNGFNEGEFRGIQRASADIAFFQLSGGLANALDDLAFERSVDVPETTSLALLAIGLVGVGFSRKKQAK